MKTKAIYLTLVLLLLLAQAAQAMSSENYALDWMIPLTSGGGAHASSSHYRIDYSVGQTTVGQANSANFATRLGFWQRFAQYMHLWLPSIFR